MNIKQEIIKNLKQKSGNSKIIESTKISNLKIDSLDLMELVMEVEAKVGTELSDEFIMKLKDKTIGDIIKELEKVAK